MISNYRELWTISIYMKMTSMESKLLIRLAKKIDSNNFNWWSCYDSSGKRFKTNDYRCCICQFTTQSDFIPQLGDAMSSAIILVQHGILHLKESNLTPFL